MGEEKDLSQRQQKMNNENTPIDRVKEIDGGTERETEGETETNRHRDR